jgi:hypothetical protein
MQNYTPLLNNEACSIEASLFTIITYIERKLNINCYSKSDFNTV